MKNYYLAAIGAVAIALGIAPNATATDASAVGLDFSLTSDKADSASQTTSKAVDGTETSPLVIPDKANAAPFGSESNAGSVAKLPPAPPQSTVAVAPKPVPIEEDAPELAPKPIDIPAATAQVPAPAPDPRPAPEAVRRSPQPTAQPTAQPAAQPAATATSSSNRSAQDDGILSFAPSDVTVSQTPHDRQTANVVTPATPGLSASLRAFPELEALFHGGTNSLVARAVGSAEGTRTPDGGKTRAYRGHVDPGNGVWNLGTFSYQHGARSPEEADQRQLKRLRNQAQTLREAALTRGIQLTLEEELNGIDLANQSPRAALSRGGYIDRLDQAKDMGLQGSDAVLWARTRAFLDPDTSRWNAPGLGNNVYSITNDQERRLRAISRAIAVQPQQNRSSVASLPDTGAASSGQSAQSRAEANADLIISLDLPPV